MQMQPTNFKDMNKLIPNQPRVQILSRVQIQLL